MLDIQSMLARLKRPRLLVQAARFGLDDYTRSTHLKRALGNDALPRSGQAVMQLIDIEGALNDERIAKRATYSVARHVEVMIALMAEARTHAASTRVI